MRDPTVRYEVRPTKEDMAIARDLVDIRHVGSKGMGVVAKQDIPANTFVGAYAGQRFTYDDHVSRVQAGETTSEYACEFWVHRKGAPAHESDVDDAYVLDPLERDANGQMRIKLQYVSPVLFINEPAHHEMPNMNWVWNIPKYRIEMWTSRPIRAGEELLICYGSAYTRTYRTACSRDGVETWRHVIRTPGEMPRVI